MSEAAGFVGITEAVEDEFEAVTEAVFEAEVVEDTGAVASTRAAWWRAARRRFRSLSAGPRCRGW